MILQALNDYYQRLLTRGEEGLAAIGYSSEKISYEIVLTPAGEVCEVKDIRDTSGRKPVPKIMNVPQPEKRASGVKPNFLWDKTSYVLGVSATSKRAAEEHQAFKSFHLEILADEDDPGIKAFLVFLRSWDANQFQPPLFSSAVMDANVVFRISGEKGYLHERSAARRALNQLKTSDGSGFPDARCLVTGWHAPLARLHPSIKGVDGAQSAGASIVSFNLDAFTSYGKSQGANAPVSQVAAFSYTTVLNHLLRRSPENHQRIRVGDMTIVFWAQAASETAAQLAEQTFMGLMEPPADDAQETGRLRHVPSAVALGRPLRDMDPGFDEGTRMFVLGLAPNAARLSIRFWLVDSLEVLIGKLAQHSEDLALSPQPWRVMPAAWQIARATAPVRDGRSKAEDVVPNLAGEVLRSILDGSRYPRSLLANILMRMRADGNLSGLRVAICKAVLVRDRRLGVGGQSIEEVPVSLDPESTNPSYLLGRLFAVLEEAQRAALGKNINATIRDRYYGAASATPASIFPVLIRNAQNHFSRLRKDKPGAAINLERAVMEIMSGLSENLPRTLRIEEQGRFAVGYYHQMQSRFTKAGVDTADETNADDSELIEGVKV